jgi:DNA-directed RNA polymerase specialized sigma24 family protein
MNNRDQLKAIITEHGLKRREVADLCRVSLHTVNSWLSTDKSKARRACPDMAVELLRMKLND